MEVSTHVHILIIRRARYRVKNIAFWSANIQRYYTVQKLVVQLLSAGGERRRINSGKLLLSLIYMCNCHIINNILDSLVRLDIFMMIKNILNCVITYLSTRHA